MPNFQVVPELICRDIEITKQFYVDVFGFNIKYEREHEQFAYFTLDGVDVMVEGIDSTGRHWLVGEMEPPFGRGINLQWDVSDLDAIYLRVKQRAPKAIFLDIEVASYQCDEVLTTQKQFIVQDPDGYLFRFCANESNP